jgi:hypothetical protein
MTLILQGALARDGPIDGIVRRTATRPDHLVSSNRGLRPNGTGASSACQRTTNQADLPADR